MASAIFRTKLSRLLTYKGIWPAKNGTIWCDKYSPGSFGLCATAVKEEEQEEYVRRIRRRRRNVENVEGALDM